jgi:hypothetical protein
VFDRYEVCIFGEPINHDQNNTEPLRFGQTFYKVHGKVLPNSCWDEQRLQQSHWMSIEMLSLLTYDTLLDKGIHILFHPLPRKMLLESIKCGSNP